MQTDILYTYRSVLYWTGLSDLCGLLGGKLVVHTMMFLNPYKSPNADMMFKYFGKSSMGNDNSMILGGASRKSPEMQWSLLGTLPSRVDKQHADAGIKSTYRSITVNPASELKTHSRKMFPLPNTNLRLVNVCLALRITQHRFYVLS